MTTRPLWMQLREESDQALEDREALYIRLLRSIQETSPIAEQIHLRLCEVRLAMFERGN
ncbi:MAG TPA: hypothetical protein VH592_04700 [Gemmataceae bacterium]|jgi:hypothetical protein